MMLLVFCLFCRHKQLNVGLMVSILAFYSDDQSLDFTEADSKINLKITKINRLKTSHRILKVK